MFDYYCDNCKTETAKNESTLGFRCGECGEFYDVDSQ